MGAPARAEAVRLALYSAAWMGVVFVLFNSCASHRDAMTVWSEYKRGALSLSSENVLRAVRAGGTDDGDVARYLAYANALLGRPYQDYFIRGVVGWQQDDRARLAGPDPRDPHITPPVVPAAPLVPWRDFSVEYPPGFFLFTLPIALATEDLDAYCVLFSLQMALLLTGARAACVALARRWGSPSPSSLVAFSVLAALALGTLVVRRYDATVSFAVAAAAWACVAGRPVLAGVALGLGIASKGLPLVLAPVVFAFFAGQRDGRALGRVALGTAGMVAAVIVPALAFAGPALYDALAYHAERPLQIESTWAAFALLAGAAVPGSVSVVDTFGSLNVLTSVDGLFNALALATPLALSLAVYARTWRAFTGGLGAPVRGIVLVRALTLLLIVWMAAGKVFSPQFVTWLVPVGFLAAATLGRGSALLLLSALVATQVVYPGGYRLGLALAGEPLFGALVLGRTALLLAFAFALWRSLSLTRLQRDLARSA